MAVFRRLAVAVGGALLLLASIVPAASAAESGFASAGNPSATHKVGNDFCDDDNLCFYQYERFRGKIWDDEFPEVGHCYNLPHFAKSVKNNLNLTVRAWAQYDCGEGGGDWFDISPRTHLPKMNPRRSFEVLEA
ncbi:hypothetical protein AB0A74_01210 [Saccharothrix sp. NPDC042600]|uniref:hypothetical protein n=1 Tax=Saccharothrix TaxID=2071 RepID=UPI0033DCEC9B|nr:hypothetical protein GCM10017745_49500 [Saccharothrix mutabilis subsp. capreolus]